MKFFKLLTVIIICLAIGFYAGKQKIEFDWNNYSPSISFANSTPPPSHSEIDLDHMWKVMDKLQTSYYDKTKLDSKKLQYGAIMGMVNALDDPYTVYLPPKENTDFKEQLAGKFEGIGAELGMIEKNVVVIAPLEGSPAQKAGLRAGDIVVKVNGESVFGKPLNEVVDKIRGPKGSAVKLEIFHKDATKTENIEIKRDTIQVKSVYFWVKPIKDIAEVDQKVFGSDQNSKVAYIKLSQFGDETNKEWLTLINELSMDLSKDKSIKGLVLDLRNNPGGYLTDATFIASDFLPMGNVVVTQESGTGEKLDMKVERSGILQNLPVVVLINKGSASASEILSGALRDYNRAKLVGETSFGKGTIQSSEDLGGGAGVHITIAKWLTPKGTWVHTKGLEPDVKVEPDQKNKARDAQLERAIQVLFEGK
jgi:carboxyl-terminal processing protease